METIPSNPVTGVQKVESREEFCRFVRALAQDFKNCPEAWENNRLDSFLEALAAWTEDMDGYYLNRSENVPMTPDWKTLSEMLQAARVYE